MNIHGHTSRNFQTRSSGKGKWKSQTAKSTKKTRQQERKIREQNRDHTIKHEKSFKKQSTTDLDPALVAVVQINFVRLFY